MFMTKEKEVFLNVFDIAMSNNCSLNLSAQIAKKKIKGTLVEL
jgi:hypothetical protein